MLADNLHIGKDCWEGSSLVISDGAAIPAATFESYPIVSSIVILFCLLYVILFIGNIILATGISFRSIFRHLSLEEIAGNNSSLGALNFASVLCVPVLALLLDFRNLSPLNLLYILSALVGYFAVKAGRFSLMGWLRKCPEAAQLLSINNRVHLVVCTILALPAFFIRVKLYIPVLLLAVLASYLVKGFKIFASNKLPILFWFLYLCALEIPTVAAIVGILV